MKKIMNSLAKKALVLFLAATFITSGVNAAMTAAQFEELVMAKMLIAEQLVAVHEKLRSSGGSVGEHYGYSGTSEGIEFDGSLTPIIERMQKLVKAMQEQLKKTTFDNESCMGFLDKSASSWNGIVSDLSTLVRNAASKDDLKECVVELEDFQKRPIKDFLACSGPLPENLRLKEFTPEGKASKALLEGDRVFPDYPGWVGDILALRKSELTTLSKEKALTDKKAAPNLKAALALINPVITELNTSIAALKKAKPGSESLFLSQKSSDDLIKALDSIKEAIAKGSPYISAVYTASNALKQKTPLAPGKRPKK